jgi:hypothetical protein
MISSTARDLPEHRQQVKDACLAQGMFPTMMEHLPATDAGAVAVSLKMVDEADAYLGVFGWRYGTVPAGYEISITEMEYNRATERGIPRLIFLMHEDHPVKGSDVEKGPGAAKLEALKQRLATTHVVNFFKSPEDLRAQVTNTLASLKDAPGSAASQSRAERERTRYHSLLVDFLNPLDDYLRGTYRVFEKLQKETGIDHFHRDPEGLKRIFAGLPKSDLRRSKWMEVIDQLQNENRTIVKLIEDNYGYDDIVLPEFRDACLEFKLHADDWAIFWKILKKQGFDTPPEVYADIVSMPFPRSFPEALQKEIANARGHASAGE